MKDDKKERFPEYVPLSYRVFTKFRKVYRQAMVRLSESAARSSKVRHAEPDGDFYQAVPDSEVKAKLAGAINKSAVFLEEDMKREEIRKIAEEISALKTELESKNLKYTNTAGTFLSRMFYPRSEKTKLWENVWTLYNSGVKSGERVLDVGGASTIFSFYLAWLGCSVAVIDNDWGNCGTIYNANHVARTMGWALKAYDKDAARPFPFPDGYFDKIFSICTVEHLSSFARRAMMKECARVLKPGGIVALTMCYDSDLKELFVDNGLRFGYREKLDKDIIKASGLSICGNKELLDSRSEENFLGALFLEKKR